MIGKITLEENNDLNYIYVNDIDNIEEISDNLSMNSDISEYKIEKIINFFKEKKLKIGMISSFEVQKEKRGQGIGRKLIEEFKKNIMQETDVDILIARTLNKQLKGFDLETFYNKYGFEGVLIEDGDLLMVSKGYREQIDNLLDLDIERKLITDWFKENKPKNEKEEKMLNFTIKRIKEKNKKLKKEKIKKTKKRLL